MWKLGILLLISTAWCQQAPVPNPEMADVFAQIFGTPKPGTNTGTGNTGTNTGNGNVQVTSAAPLENKNQGTIVPPLVNNNDGKVEECMMTDGGKGECVNYYLCNTTTNQIIKDGAGLLDIRLNDGACSSYIDLCCDPGDKTTVPIIPIPKPEEPVRQGCGWRNPNGADFQTTGDVNGETKFGEFPWACALLKVAPVNDNQPDGQKLHVYVGGGSLIHPSVVLTAAHYVAQKKDQLHVRAGEWDTQTIKEIYPFQDRDVASIEVHRDFNDGNLFYDVALLFLSEPMTLAPNVGVACLPAFNELTVPATRCFATGWGKDQFGKEGRYQVILKKVEVPVVDRKTCQRQLRATRLGRYFELHSSFMCAGGEDGVDTCRGDGGAPLSCPIENEIDRFQQSGIVAWGIGCATKDVPGVYVDVAKVRNWIDDKVIGKGYDPKVYEAL